MPSRNDVVREQLDELAQDLRDLWTAIAVDPKTQARKERAWRILSGVFAAVATMGARRVATKIWAILTGEEPPAVREAENTVR